MRPVCLLDRTKNLHQSDGLHFISDSLKNTSKTLGKRIRKFARYDEGMKRHLVSSILIGQLGKNYTHGYDALIRGEELLKIACDTVREAQRITGGRLVYLECEDVPSLIRFYEEKRILIIRYAKIGRRRKGRILRQISHSDGKISEVNCAFRFEHSKIPLRMEGDFLMRRVPQCVTRVS